VAKPTLFLQLLGAITITPNPAAPGVKGLQTAVNDVAMWAEITCGLALVGSIVALAAGHAFQLRHATEGGKLGVIWSLVAAFLVGIATALINAALAL